MATGTYLPFLAGQRVTAGALNLALLAGVCVFRAYRGTSQNIPSGAEAAGNALQWDQVDIDVLGGWNSGNPGVWTCTQAGKYMLAGTVSFKSAAGGTTRDACWFVNGALIQPGRAATREAGFPSTALTVQARTVPVALAVGDTVSLVPANDSGVASPGLGTETGSFRPHITITYAGP